MISARDSRARVGQVWRHLYTGRHALIVSRLSPDRVGEFEVVWSARWLESPLAAEIWLPEAQLVVSASPELFASFAPVWEPVQ